MKNKNQEGYCKCGLLRKRKIVRTFKNLKKQEQELKKFFNFFEKEKKEVQGLELSKQLNGGVGDDQSTS